MIIEATEWGMESNVAQIFYTWRDVRCFSMVVTRKFGKCVTNRNIRTEIINCVIHTAGPGVRWEGHQGTGRGRSWITGLARISGLGPNSEPRGNNRSFPETRERDRVLMRKIGSRDSIFGLVNSTYSFAITNHNQHASNIKYLANLIKKYWTYFRYQ